MRLQTVKNGIRDARIAIWRRCGIPRERFEPVYTVNRSEEFWTGWALAYYQWESCLSFEEIVQYVPIAKIRDMYMPYHEMDIRSFVEHMDVLIAKARPDTNLKRYRKLANLSQSMLAKSSGVPVRTIQQYEQRQKNINKAQAESLLMLASALSCDPTDLIEKR
ncbi:MAG: helix-turn-helix transcriptional regulator [Lachnospiraceae bacterium]|nr:helix-turn-helix transcriptional regulator [Lachnospiraceae bacterium]